MKTTKIYDLAVKTGSYTDRSGETKNRYNNVGSILQMEDGGKMILMNRYFNPAGVPYKDGSDQIIISMFKPKDKDGEQSADPAQAATSASTPAANTFNDDIPF